MLICAISDTHGFHDRLNLPSADILIHAGDFSHGRGSIQQVHQFNEWLGTLDYKHRILVPGNHDFPLEENLLLMRAIMSNCQILVDEEIIIDGLKIYGSPWQPEFGRWAYNLPRGERLARIWDNIPKDTDILITHGPPKNILDTVIRGNQNVGCEELAKKVIEIAPKLHICGHLHESRGHLSFSKTHFINASICTVNYTPSNYPYLIEIDNKEVISIQDNKKFVFRS